MKQINKADRYSYYTDYEMNELVEEIMGAANHDVDIHLFEVNSTGNRSADAQAVEHIMKRNIYPGALVICDNHRHTVVRLGGWLASCHNVPVAVALSSDCAAVGAFLLGQAQIMVTTAALIAGWPTWSRITNLHLMTRVDDTVMVGLVRSLARPRNYIPQFGMYGLGETYCSRYFTAADPGNDHNWDDGDDGGDDDDDDDSSYIDDDYRFA